jgi:hypothetical protein
MGFENDRLQYFSMLWLHSGLLSWGIESIHKTGEEE